MIGKRIFLLCVVFILTGWLSAYGAVTIVTENMPGSGTHGHPYNAVPVTEVYSGAPVYDLAALGYVEREFILSGTANTYKQSGFWGSNGKWQVSVAKSNMPYTTRIIVRYPTSSAKFNGTVVFEWLNETTYSSTSPDWAESHDFFFREGYAYVGVTAMNGEAGPPFLKWWDPVRYGNLSISTDGLSYDIFTQVAQAIKTYSSTILGGLTPKKLLACGDSQSAFRLTTYVNAIHPHALVYNGFLIHGRASTEAPIGDGLISLSPITQIRTDNTTPVIQLETEGDIVELLFAWGRQSDNNYLRTWEIPGAAHIDLFEGIYEVTVAYRDLGWVPPVCTFGVPSDFGGGLANSMPNHRIENAAWAALNKWVNTGTRAPSANRIQTTLFNTVVYDQYGNAKGGIRLPEVDVPIKTYTSWNTSTNKLNNIDASSLLNLFLSINNPSWSVTPTTMAIRGLGLCIMEGFDTPFSTAILKKLYPTHSDYVTKYTAAAKKLLDAGFLTQVDYNEAIAEAQSASIPY
jgi:Alpha/beta hydrolase domain